MGTRVRRGEDLDEQQRRENVRQRQLAEIPVLTDDSSLLAPTNSKTDDNKKTEAEFLYATQNQPDKGPPYEAAETTHDQLCRGQPCLMWWIRNLGTVGVAVATPFEARHRLSLLEVHQVLHRVRVPPHQHPPRVFPPQTLTTLLLLCIWFPHDPRIETVETSCLGEHLYILSRRREERYGGDAVGDERRQRTADACGSRGRDTRHRGLRSGVPHQLELLGRALST